MATILITGGSGLIGKALQEELSSRGHSIKLLTTGKNNKSKSKMAFDWDIKNFTIDEKAFEDVDIIIHLAGANIAGKRWTAAYKQEILQSRVLGLALLQKAIENHAEKPKRFISMSASGYYADPTLGMAKESDPKGQGFLSDVCEAWEHGAKAMENMGIPTVIFRCGVVLAPKGGFAEAFLKTKFLRIIPTTGKAENRIPWIHIEDVVGALADAAEGKIEAGTYNLGAPEEATQKDFVHALDHAFQQKSIHPNVPSFFLKIMLGELSVLALSDQSMSAQKISNSGYIFKFPKLSEAVNSLFKNKS